MGEQRRAPQPGPRICHNGESRSDGFLPGNSTFDDSHRLAEFFGAATSFQLFDLIGAAARIISVIASQEAKRRKVCNKIGAPSNSRTVWACRRHARTHSSSGQNGGDFGHGFSERKRTECFTTVAPRV